MDKRLNPKQAQRIKNIKVLQKEEEGFELVRKRKRQRRKGTVLFHIGKDGNIEVENREFI